MSESVDILIKADDQASQKFKDTAVNVDKSLRRVEQIMSSLEEPSERYNKQLRELEHLQQEGAISAEQFAIAQDKLKQKIEGNAASMKDVGGQTKKTTDFVKTLASMTGSSELGNLAGQLGDVADKAGQFSEVSKAGGAGATAFKLGLVGLAATAGFTVGKALGDLVWQTKEYERGMDRAREAGEKFNASMLAMGGKGFGNQLQDIELIRNPEQKQAAYKALLQQTENDVASVTKQLEVSQRVADEWADAWQVTGDRKEYAIQAAADLENDKARLEQLKAQRDEVRGLASERTREVEAIRAANEAKEKSTSFIDGLRQEVEYMKATREEQIKLDALRNTTSEDTGRAEQLLRERDAIIAQKEATEEKIRVQERARDEAAKAAEKAQQDAD